MFTRIHTHKAGIPARRRRRWWQLLLICFLAVLLPGAFVMTCLPPCSLWTRPRAQQHEEGDMGYIPVAAQPMELDIQAPQGFVYDVDAGEILWQKGEDRVVYPASITKLWTILCALRYLSPEEIITVGDEVSLIDPESSVAYIQEGMQLTVEMLIEGMLLPSGNDAAYVIAAAAGRRVLPDAPDAASAVEAFIAEMNRYAKAFGLCGTVFTTPDGLAGVTHYTTVEDMILVCRMALEHPVISKYTAMVRDEVTYASGETNTWTNTNRLLDPQSRYYREGVIGLKTGSLSYNYCVTVAYEKDGHRYLIGVLGARNGDQRFADACTLIDAIG